eukprot:456214-Pelagomonas_calceolata.AAC.5
MMVSMVLDSSKNMRKSVSGNIGQLNSPGVASYTIYCVSVQSGRNESECAHQASLPHTHSGKFPRTV